jgi:hypothetical protein
MTKITSIISSDNDYTFIISSDDTTIYSLDVSGILDLSSIKETLSDKFYLSGVSDFSESCNITIGLYSKDGNEKTINIMESTPSKSIVNHNKRTNILSSVIKELMSHKDKLGNDSETQMFMETVL